MKKNSSAKKNQNENTISPAKKKRIIKACIFAGIWFIAFLVLLFTNPLSANAGTGRAFRILYFGNVIAAILCYTLFPIVLGCLFAIDGHFGLKNEKLRRILAIVGLAFIPVAYLIFLIPGVGEFSLQVIKNPSPLLVAGAMIFAGFHKPKKPKAQKGIF